MYVVVVLRTTCVVYFRIFDVDNDKKIDLKDLRESFRLLFGRRMSKEDQDTLAGKIIEESDQGQKGHLDFDDLQKVLWATDIEKRCTMHFFQS